MPIALPLHWEIMLKVRCCSNFLIPQLIHREFTLISFPQMECNQCKVYSSSNITGISVILLNSGLVHGRHQNPAKSILTSETSEITPTRLLPSLCFKDEVTETQEMLSDLPKGQPGQRLEPSPSSLFIAFCLLLLLPSGILFILGAQSSVHSVIIKYLWAQVFHCSLLRYDSFITTR